MPGETRALSPSMGARDKGATAAMHALPIGITAPARPEASTALAGQLHRHSNAGRHPIPATDAVPHHWSYALPR
jgi:hypothetical protein